MYLSSIQVWCSYMASFPNPLRKCRNFLHSCMCLTCRIFIQPPIISSRILPSNYVHQIFAKLSSLKPKYKLALISVAVCFLLNLTVRLLISYTIISPYSVGLFWIRSSLPGTVIRDSDQKCGYFVRSPVWGRLGNQLFVYASFYGMIKDHDQKANKTAFIHVAEWSDYRFPEELFEHLSIPCKPVSYWWIFARNFYHIMENFYTTGQYITDGLDSLACDGQNVLVGGYRESWYYFKDYFDDIKRELTFKPEIRSKGQKLIGDSLRSRNLTRDKCTIVGVHLRRGDFLYWISIYRGQYAADENYLKLAVSFYESWYFHGKLIPQYQKDSDDKLIANDIPEADRNCLVFFVFGDDHEWNLDATSKIKLKEPSKTHFVHVNWRNSEPEVDMEALKVSDHLITSTGTFSWWAGFFARGMVVHQKDYARSGSVVDTQFETRTFIMKEWISL